MWLSYVSKTRTRTALVSSKQEPMVRYLVYGDICSVYTDNKKREPEQEPSPAIRRPYLFYSRREGTPDTIT